MGWDDLNLKDQEKIKQTQEVVDLRNAYKRCFQTNDGKRVLEDLTKRFIYDNDTPFSSNNVNYEAAYRNGERGAVKFIIHIISKEQ